MPQTWCNITLQVDFTTRSSTCGRKILFKLGGCRHRYGTTVTSNTLHHWEGLVSGRTGCGSSSVTTVKECLKKNTEDVKFTDKTTDL